MSTASAIDTTFYFCKVADASDWENPEFQSTASLLGLKGKSRKAWEFIHVYNGLKHLGLLNGETRGIGLGVGHECLIYAFTNVCKEVVATDLYNSNNWSTAAMSTSDVYEKNQFPYQRDRLVVQHMDMTNVEYPDAAFDFVWSCCSIEHVSSFEALHKVYAEIHRVLKPGGVAALTTEFNPTDRHSYEPHMLFTDQYWIEHWLTGNNPLVQGFELLDPPNFSLTSAAENEPAPRRSRGTQIQVISKDIILNSIAFFLRKTDEFTQPYSDTWLSEPWRIYLAACAASKRGNVAEAQQLFKQLLQDQSLDTRLRIAASRYLSASLLDEGKLGDAKELCIQIIPYLETGGGGDHLLPLAHSFKRVGLFDEAKDIHEKVEQLPGSHVNQVIRSILYQAEYFDRQGDFKKALELTEKAYQYTLSGNTDETHKVYFHLGLYSEKLGQIETAIAHYQKAIASPQSDTKFKERCERRLSSCLKYGQNSGRLSRLHSLFVPIKDFIKRQIRKP